MSKEHPNVELLRRFNNWRRGGNGAMPAPAEVGVAIDWAVEVCGAKGRLEVLEREHAEFYERWHAERRQREAMELLCRQLFEAEQAKNQKDWTAVIRALEKVGAGETAAVEDDIERARRLT